MSLNEITVSTVLPDWKYCDFQSIHKKGKTNGKRCKFCQEIKKRGQTPRYFCVLFDNELVYKNGAVEKTVLCDVLWSKNRVINSKQELPIKDSTIEGIAPKEVVKIVRKSLKTVQKNASTLYNQGIPLNQAYETATGQVLDEWKETL